MYVGRGGAKDIFLTTCLMVLQLRHTEFSICSVLGHIGNIMSSRYKIDRPVPAVPFIYHDDIIHNNGIHKCKYFRRAVTKGSCHSIRYRYHQGYNRSVDLEEKLFTAECWSLLQFVHCTG